MRRRCTSSWRRSRGKLWLWLSPPCHHSNVRRSLCACTRIFRISRLGRFYSALQGRHEPMFFMQYKSCECNSQALVRIPEMRCRRIQHYLLALSEGELDQRTRGKVETHVAACPDCASALRGLQQTLQRIRDLDVPEPAAAFWEEFGPALHQRIRREAAIQPERRRFSVRDLFVLPRPVLAVLAGGLIPAPSLPPMPLPPGQRPPPTLGPSPL